ncbi:MAG: sigma-54 dependent transcriptional regulator [Desulfobulbaceae bacterium]|jgi:two-component system response regulator HydG|nr:sigma-54 dependent transcriptional regulator [Desulfobulbaceae bacterium]
MTAPNAITILLADDDKAHRTMLKANLSGAAFNILEVDDGDQVLATLADHDIDLILLDLKMERMDGLATLSALDAAGVRVPVIVITAFSSVESAVVAMKRGAFDYVTKPIDMDELQLIIARALHVEKLEQENIHLKERLLENFSFANIIGSSKVMQEMFATLSMVAPTDATVLIGGESGTGKELIANALHQTSSRKDGPFIKVNCAALHENLLESELFGHEKGAFTGATEQRKGRFELAHRGTLFLDEIGDMTVPTQAKILRVLQEGEIERLGGSKTIKVDVRLVAASHRDLEAMVEQGEFRQDLFFRLSVVPIILPPLRERGSDIPELARYFLKRYAQKNKKDIRTIHPQALNLLMHHDWPGNIRELENCMERAVILCQGEQITPAELPPQLTPHGQNPADSTLPATTSGLTLRDMEREMIRVTLEETAGNKSQAAKNLGIARQTLLNKIKEYGLE